MTRKFFTLLTVLCAVPLFADAQNAPAPRGQPNRGTPHPGGQVQRAPAPGQQGQQPAARQPAGRQPVGQAAAPQGAAAPVAARAATARQPAAQPAGRTPAVQQRGAGVAQRPGAQGAAPAGVNQARAGTTVVARSATPVFNDMSRMGGGYAACREMYNTCMDQFCAQMSADFRRCICSDRFRDFEERDNVLTQAISMLQDFGDQNLTVVQLSAAEVSATRTATEGELAAQRDTSAASRALDGIRRLLSGQPADQFGSGGGGGARSAPVQINTIGMFDVSDIFSGGGGIGSNIWSGGGGANLANMRGQQLYSEVNRQCIAMARETCESNAVLQMVQSAYSILIGQDCESAERRVAEKQVQLENKVREVERMLWSARLDEYRHANSSSVNECIENVRAEIVGPNTACGPNWRMCLDFTGRFININTGEPILTPHLFQLANEIDLTGDNRDLRRTFTDRIRRFADRSLSTCRDDRDFVWERFMDRAVIEIAQAQAAKLEEVKESCIDTIAECYDARTGQLGQIDNTRAQMSGALAARTTTAMCVQRVAACASLYCPTPPKPDGSSGCQVCRWDGNGRIENPECGLGALIRFVEAVDTVRVAENCRTDLDNYLERMICATSNAGGTSATTGPANWQRDCGIRLSPGTIYSRLRETARQHCAAGALPQDIMDAVHGSFRAFAAAVQTGLGTACSGHNGMWTSSLSDLINDMPLNRQFYAEVFRRTLPDTATVESHRTQLFQNEALSILGGEGVNQQGAIGDAGWGLCLENTGHTACTQIEGARWANGRCTLPDSWYRSQCEGALQGYWLNNTCYTLPPS